MCFVSGWRGGVIMWYTYVLFHGGGEEGNYAVCVVSGWTRGDDFVVYVV